MWKAQEQILISIFFLPELKVSVEEKELSSSMKACALIVSPRSTPLKVPRLVSSRSSVTVPLKALSPVTGTGRSKIGN